MSADEPKDDGSGCLLIIGIVSVSIGSGYIWGAGLGWLVLGLACLGIVVCAACFSRGR